jgi:DmsE family decaheme c-type cytochrome
MAPSRHGSIWPSAVAGLRTSSITLLALLVLGGARLEAQPSASIDDAQTAVLCQACHRDKFEALAKNPHSVLGDEDWQARTGEAIACRNCHGDVSAHIRGGGGRRAVFGFRAEPVTERNARCLGCHRKDHPGFDRSPHGQAGLACTSCHQQHAEHPGTTLLRQPAGPPDVEALSLQSRVCFECHTEQFALFDLNEHHRLREGVLECTSCHDPHEPATRSLLGGFKQQQCIACHTDKGGPFVFEHPASRVESCTVCHAPHGSPNRHLLAHERVAELCISCHAEIPQFHIGFSPTAPSRFSLDTQCTNCHSQIHGSNFSPYFLR